MSRRAAALLLLGMAGAVVLLVLLTRSPSDAPRRGRRDLPFLRVTPARAGAAAPGASGAIAGAVTPGETVRVTLFFPDASAGRLHAVERDVPKPAGPGAFLRTLFEELVRGPGRDGLVVAIPPRVQLRNGFLMPQGEVVLDLAVDASLSFGSAEELAIVASLVDTVLQNVANSSRVRILINGEPAESLGGHVDLTRPLRFLRNEVAS